MVDEMRFYDWDAFLCRWSPPGIDNLPVLVLLDDAYHDPYHIDPRDDWRVLVVISQCRNEKLVECFITERPTDEQIQEYKRQAFEAYREGLE